MTHNTASLTGNLANLLLLAALMFLALMFLTAPDKHISSEYFDMAKDAGQHVRDNRAVQ